MGTGNPLPKSEASCIYASVRIGTSITEDSLALGRTYNLLRTAFETNAIELRNRLERSLTGDPTRYYVHLYEVLPTALTRCVITGPLVPAVTAQEVIGAAAAGI